MLNLLVGVMLTTVPLVNAPQNAITLQSTDTTWTETQVVRLQADTNIKTATAGSNYDVKCNGLNTQTVLCEVKSNWASGGPILTLGYEPKADNNYRFDFTNSDSTIVPVAPEWMTQGIVTVTDGIPSGSTAIDTTVTNPEKKAMTKKKTGNSTITLLSLLFIMGMLGTFYIRKNKQD